MAATSHPLNSNWTLWAGDANEPDWGKKLQPLCHISTVEEFWQNYNHIPKPSVCFFDGEFKTKVGPSNKVRVRRERGRAVHRYPQFVVSMAFPFTARAIPPRRPPTRMSALLPPCSKVPPWGVPAQRLGLAVAPRAERPDGERRSIGLADAPACKTRVVTGGSATRRRQVVLPLCFPARAK